MTAKNIEANDSASITLSTDQGEPRVDTRVLAAQLGNQHESVMKTLKTYPADFKGFGILRFEIGKPSAGSKGGRPEEYALLNEDQCYLLLTYSRNTAKVRALKINLVKAFREARLGCAQLTLLARKKEASTSGRRLARWRYDKPGMYEHIERLKEQLRLPFDQEGIQP